MLDVALLAVVMMLPSPSLAVVTVAAAKCLIG